jgi:hypothetical protein
MVLGWVLLAHAGPLAPQARADDLATVLARMREALGGQGPEDRTGEVLIRGKSRRRESAGDYRLRSTADGKFVHRIDGPLSETHGFNGRTCWSVDPTGMPRTLELYERDLWQLLAGLQTGHWASRLDPASAALAPGDSTADAVVLDVRQGRFKAKLHVDRSTWLPTMLRRSGIRGEETWTFAEYRGAFGRRLPGKITHTRGGGMEDTYEVRSVEAAAPAPAGVYDPVTTRPDDARFNPHAPPRIEVKRARTGHVLVRPKLDGLDLGWFIFDTGAGASTVLHTGAAARLRNSLVGAAPVTSFLGTVRCTVLRGESLELGPLTVAKPFFLEMDLGFVQEAMGEEVVGIVGYDLLSRCVAEIELAEDSIKLYDPPHYRLDPAAWQRLVLNTAVPLIPAAFEGGHKGLFRIDVGASGKAFGNVVFHAPAVEEMHLLEHRKVTVTRLGPTRVATGTLAWFELAGHRFEDPEVVFALDSQGPLGDEYVEGNLGVEFLKPFRIVLDYQHERLALLLRTEERR